MWKNFNFMFRSKNLKTWFRYFSSYKYFHSLLARINHIIKLFLKNKNARDIMLYLQGNPGKHLLEIANALNLNHHTVKWHIKKMYLAELIDGDTSNSAYPVYYPIDIGIQSIRNFSDHLKKPGRAA
ncbi:MAG: winged helix-turn-helix transcriptional regulator [Thermoplasmatales archaeon]|nr:winged helix-turn-helix transcriptional regulator [Thermoplasmatales archaeon]